MPTTSPRTWRPSWPKSVWPWPCTARRRWCPAATDPQRLSQKGTGASAPVFVYAKDLGYRKPQLHGHSCRGLLQRPAQVDRPGHRASAGRGRACDARPVFHPSGSAPERVQRQDGRWAGEVACIIASGPSLTAEDCELVRDAGWRTIAVNDSYRRAPFADALYAADFKWWKHHIEAIRESGFQGELWSQCGDAPRHFGINWIESSNRPGLGQDGIIHYGGNSGYQAINLAYLWGARAIVLLGLDCSAGPGGKAHWFGQHASPLNQRQLYDNWRTRFKPLAADLARLGVPVLNASRTTALDCFPRVTLEAALADQRLAPRGGSRQQAPKPTPATV